MSSDGSGTKLQAFLLACLLFASAFTSPHLATVAVAGNVAGNTGGNDSVEEVWPTKQGDSARTGYVSSVAPPANNPSAAWKTVQNDVIGSSPAVGNDAIYIGSETKDRVYGLNTTDGTERWSFDASGNVRSPTLAHGAVYAGDSTGELYALNPTNGSVIWNRSLGDDIVGSPVVIDHTMYVTAANNGQVSVWRLDADNGHDWWQYSVTGNTGSEPAVRDDTVYFSVDTQVHALDRISANNEWITSLDQSGGLGGPTAGNDAVFVVGQNSSAENGTVYSLGTQAGNVEWSQDTSTEPIGSVALAHGTVYVTAADSQSNALLHLDATDGAMSSVSKSHDLRTSPAIAEKTVFVGTDEGVLASNASSGDTRYFHDIVDDGSPVVRSAPAVGNQSVYVGLDRTNDSVYKLTGEDFDYAPDAVLDAPSDVVKGETASFDGSASSDFDGSIASYEWDFDDDGTFEKTGRSVDHTFDTVGNEQVTLRVVDDDGVANTAQTSVTVLEPADLSVTDYTVSDTTVGIGDTITVDATVENTGGVSGSLDVSLYDNGTWEDERDVTVDAHDTNVVSLSGSLEELGNHSVTVESLDPTQVEVRDETPPPAPTSVSSNGWHYHLYLIWDEVYDLESGLDHYEVKVEDGNWQNAGDVRTFSAESTRTGKIDGQVRAVDNFDNAGPATNATFKVDNTPPTVPNISVPGGWVDADGAWVTIQNSTDGHSGFKRYHVDVDGSPWKYPTEPNVTLSLSELDLGTGSHYVLVETEDNRYNKDQAEYVEVKIDETSPGVSVETSNSSGTSTLEVEVTDAHSGLDADNVSITVDGESISGNLSGNGDKVVYTENATPGTHYVEVTATDNVYNQVNGIWSVTVSESDDSDDDEDSSNEDGDSNDDTDDTNDGGGGGGSSSVPPPAVNVEITEQTASHVRAKITSARADSPASVSMSGLGSGRASFHTLRVTPRSEGPEPRFFLDATVVNSPDAGALPSDETLGFLRAKTTYIDNSELASATVRFRVPTDVASPDEVTLYRYRNSEWQPVSTEFVGERGGKYAFRATTSGVSLFAVGVTYETTTTTTSAGTTETATSNVTTTPNATTPNATTEAALDDGTVTTANESETAANGSGSVPGFGPVAALVALVVAGFVAIRRG